MNKKIIAIITALLLAASLASCANDTPDEESTTDNNIIIPGTSDSTDGTDETESTETEDTSDTDESETQEPAEIVFVDKKDTVYVLAQNQAANLRTAPSLDSSTVHKSVPNGTALERIAVSEDGGWSRVVYEEVECYIRSSLLTTLEDPDAGFVPVSKTLTLKSSLFVRMAPYNAGEPQTEAVDTLYAGDVVTVVAENTVSGWYKVTFDGTYATEGYIVNNPKYFVETSEEESGTEENAGGETAEAQTYEINAAGYTRVKLDGVAGYYEKSDRAIVISTESYAAYEALNVAKMTPAEYAELVMEANNVTSAVNVVNHIPAFEYEKAVDGQTFRYYAFSYAGEDAYWLVTFMASTDRFEDYKTEFETIARSFKLQ